MDTSNPCQSYPAGVRGAGHWTKLLVPFEAWLQALDRRVLEEISAFDPALAPQLGDTLSSHGKRLRPVVALLSAEATGGIRPAHLDLALIVEMIHLATLVHDDIVDGAVTRRGAPTAFLRWGADVSVLLGDCLFSHALKICADLPREVFRSVAASVCVVCTGEILQLQRRFDLRLGEGEYLRIAQMKTGELFAMPCQLAASLNSSPSGIQEALGEYGRLVGTAFQIYDDCLDLLGSEEETGKTLGTDLGQGRLTLPLLYLLDSPNGGAKECVLSVLGNGSPEKRSELLEFLFSHGALERAGATVQRLLEQSRNTLRCLPEKEAGDRLCHLTYLLEEEFQTLVHRPVRHSFFPRNS
ncbi:polyprenyl synthetase family protein [Candidatus Methylacidithermus pantelleriae]|uniref:polyprenyl synthetase family protein n=1 Tax=Candidatus Methylacidithermus pantelleriae TaxID=2744239 RepID=UPI001F35CC86|nr:polyprenyl synthetase family protein [Candidatus Methylacidithermus pantelleriae]